MAFSELRIPYNDFQMGEFIDPEQHDTNNFYFQSKINEIILVLNQLLDSSVDGKSGADLVSLTEIAPFTSKKLQAFLEEAIARLNSQTKGASGADFIASTPISGVTGNTVQAQLESLRALLTTEVNRITALTARVGTNETSIANRYTKAEVDAKDSSLQTQINANKTDYTNKSTANTNAISALQTQVNTHTHDTRYMTRAELTPYLQGGDTIVHMDVYTIVTSNNGDGTFTYRDNKGGVFTGSLGESGEQIFRLTGEYSKSLNHIKAIVGDTLHRSVASGGLKEIDSKSIALTNPEGAGAEITIEYFQRLGVSGEHSVSYGTSTPPPSSGSIMWFKVVG